MEYDFKGAMSTIDKLFLQQVQKKSIKLICHSTQSFSFSWQVLKRNGCFVKFTNLVKAFHSLQVNILILNTQSRDFRVAMGVKQWCVLAATPNEVYWLEELLGFFLVKREWPYCLVQEQAGEAECGNYDVKFRSPHRWNSIGYW